MSTLDRIPPLPLAAIDEDDVFGEVTCPWCRCLCRTDRHPVDDVGAELIYRYLCGCGGVFEIFNDEDDGLMAVGVRSGTDLRYMDAMGVTEAMVDAHHAQAGASS